MTRSRRRLLVAGSTLLLLGCVLCIALPTYGATHRWTPPVGSVSLGSFQVQSILVCAENRAYCRSTPRRWLVFVSGTVQGHWTQHTIVSAAVPPAQTNERTVP